MKKPQPAPLELLRKASAMRRVNPPLVSAVQRRKPPAPSSKAAIEKRQREASRVLALIDSVVRGVDLQKLNAVKRNQGLGALLLSKKILKGT